MKTEQILMCVMLVLCAALVFASLAAMLAAPIEPVTVAQAVMHGMASTVATTA